jgi:small-conductance mechanosensitive channel
MAIPLLVIGQVPLTDLDQFVDTTEVTGWDFLWAAIALVVGAILARVTRNAIRTYAGRANLPSNTVDLLGTTAQWAVFAIGVVVALTFVGLNLAPVWILIIIVAAVLIVGGRTLLEAFGAGVLLQTRSPFTSGDLVQLGDHQGVVKEINSRVVVLDAIDGRRVFLPNQQVLANPIVNLTHRKLRMSTLYLDVTYSTDLDRACDVARASLEDLEQVLSRPAPGAEVMSFEASAIRIQLRFWHPSDLPSEWAAVDVAARSVRAAYAAAGIEFAFPQATLWWGEDQRPDAGA